MKARIKFIAFIICIISFPLNTWGQCGEERPNWAIGNFQKTLGNSYLESVKVTGSSYEDARLKAQKEIERRRSTAVGEQDAWIKSKLEAEYWETCRNGIFTGYFLYQTLKNPTFKYYNVVITDKYPFTARTFVPGMAQLHKGSKGKGVFFIVGEAAFIGGIVACEGMRASYESKINTTHNASDRQTYIDNADMMKNLRNGCIAGAALLYAWNIIDGTVAKGKKHVQVFGNADMKITPFVTPQLASGFSLTLNFN